ncbi:MAG: NACHT domain-containing protein, partial [Candidatus Eisenbacteria bacterium]|nr:NACHT domain-containing protein [Candidatus Eisenbacteria bacterium]
MAARLYGDGRAGETPSGPLPVVESGGHPLAGRLHERSGLVYADEFRLAVKERSTSALTSGCGKSRAGPTFWFERRSRGHVSKETRSQDVAGELRDLRLAAGTLPAPLTSFVGRREEIRRIRELLAQVRLLTLTGPAGTGKTRLAIEVVRDAADSFPGGVAFISLGATPDPGLVVPSIAQSLQVAVSAAASALDVLCENLQERRLLLVLDNFEHVVAAAPEVARLLAACRGVKILVTSRVVLRISGEHTYPVPPLDLPDGAGGSDPKTLLQSASISLFVERAWAARAGFVLTENNAEDVAEICRRLDGIPLAIELAAARITIFNPATIRERLQNRLDLLKTGDRDRPARHQTLRQAIAWSYGLLSGSEQRAFRTLAVFAGGFTLESAEALLPDAAEAVEALLDRSLLQRREEGSEELRFLMLDTIRELGREKLQEAGEDSAVRQAHADHYTALAEQAALHLTGPDQGRWLDRLDLEHDNLRAAWTWAMEEDRAETVWRLAAALWRFWLSRGYLHEGWRKAETLPAMPAEQSDTDLRARALHGIGTLAHNL